MRPRMRLRTLAILIVGATGIGGAGWLWLNAGPAPDSFAERYAVRAPGPPPPAFQRYMARRLFDGALAFAPTFLAAPQSVAPLVPHNMTGRDGLVLAFALPASPITPPVALAPAPQVPASAPLDLVPLPPTRPRVIIDTDRVFDDAAI